MYLLQWFYLCFKDEPRRKFALAGSIIILLFMCSVSYAQSLEDKIDKTTLSILNKWDAQIFPKSFTTDKFELSDLDRAFLDAATLCNILVNETDILTARYLYDKMQSKENFTDFWIRYLTERVAIKNNEYIFSDDANLREIKSGTAIINNTINLKIIAYMSAYKNFLKNQCNQSQAQVNFYQSQIDFLEKGE